VPPVETKPVETKPVETKPVETKPVETKPAETKPAETKPAETKPAETKPAETKPVAQQAPPPTPTPTPQPAPQPIAQPVPPVTPSPLPAQIASIAPGALLVPISDALHAAHCALADAAPQESGGVAVLGFADQATASALQRQVDTLAGAQPVAWHVRTIDPVFCPALAALRSVSAAAGTAHGHIGLTLNNNVTSLHDGEAILPRVTMPDFGGELRVDYFAHDDTLAHLYPTLADPAAKLFAQPSRKFAPGDRLALGDAGPGKPQWQSGEPYGTDMIIAVASSVPLKLAPAHNAEDKAEGYIADLGRAIEQARAAGARVSAAVLPVEALPKAK
jgi:serine/threonine-protein kinase